MTRSLPGQQLPCEHHFRAGFRVILLARHTQREVGPQWSEDVRAPLVASACHAAYLFSVHWSPTRSALREGLGFAACQNTCSPERGPDIQADMEERHSCIACRRTGRLLVQARDGWLC